MVATETNDAYRFHGFRNEYSWIDDLYESYELTHHHLGSVLPKWWKKYLSLPNDIHG